MVRILSMIDDVLFLIMGAKKKKLDLHPNAMSARMST